MPSATTKIGPALALLCAALPGLAPAATAAQSPSQRLLIDTASAKGHASLRGSLQQKGYRIALDHPQLNFMVVQAPAPTKGILSTEAGARAALAQLKTDPRVASAARDRVRPLIRPGMKQEFFGTAANGQPGASITAANPRMRKTSRIPTPYSDPAFSLKGLMWNMNRINAVSAWSQPLGYGFQSIKVGVADTGLDYTHAELKNKVDSVVDFTLTESPNICQYSGGKSDAELAAEMGAPASDLDFNGHGSWIGGNIAAAMDYYEYGSYGINGIAPFVQLVALKISQNCGAAYDSEIIDAFTYAADHGIDVVSISFGGYVDRTDPEQDLIYRFYQRAVNYAWSKGTLIVAAAGNEHVRVGFGGQVISHGALGPAPGGTDYYGLWETPGGIPGVVVVSSTGNVVNKAADVCPEDSLSADDQQWCKPNTDKHLPIGEGKRNQLAYYSNFGPRVDFAAPGGARKFNLPLWDRGGTEGWPWTGTKSILGGSSEADGYNAWEEFSITSNWAAEIPCVTFTGDGTFLEQQCYSTIQGTSMATPHVSAVAALALSTHPEVWKNPAALVTLLRSGAQPIYGNRTTSLSATDTSPGDSDGFSFPCTYGYCHLGTHRISDLDAYGAGLIDAYGAVSQP